MTRVRPLAALPSSAPSLAMAVAACGSAGTTLAPASSGTDVDQLLRRRSRAIARSSRGASTSPCEVDKGGEPHFRPGGAAPVRAVRVAGRGAAAQVRARRRDDRRGPEPGRSARRRRGTPATSTSFGRDYVGSRPVFAQLKAGYEEAQKKRPERQLESFPAARHRPAPLAHGPAATPARRRWATPTRSRSRAA